MHRDMNLIRQLLLLYEGDEPKPDLSEFSEDQQVYHSALLIEAKLVDGSILNDEIGLPARHGCASSYMGRARVSRCRAK
jgi:hypothetical protein